MWRVPALDASAAGGSVEGEDDDEDEDDDGVEDAGDDDANESTFASLSPSLSLKRLRTSRTLRPSVGASTVTATAVAPMASAFRSIARTNIQGLDIKSHHTFC